MYLPFINYHEPLVMSHDRALEKGEVNRIIEYKKKKNALTSSSSDKNVLKS